ncbi:FmdB family zinc ribbon protein [Desulfosoma caldarium]|uniref:Putative FmdB family regulatory protein n=1 Tax=Desulfosoma caldarium TaxID=610254 RepID=A0A3N1UMR2_9BACT|nr:FmdB family zinc ribbon protein [Desulfosoma caldarium]ROQ90689.1 putative FmdB family regulatory protein [Desulfosoma caldarium]
MPIYEYVCTHCGEVSEHLVLGKDEAVSCPACGSAGVKKLLSVSSRASGAKDGHRVPGPRDTGCCGTSPAAQGCVPGSCCGKAP